MNDFNQCPLMRKLNKCISGTRQLIFHPRFRVGADRLKWNGSSGGGHPRSHGVERLKI